MHILVVDDDIDIRNLVRAALSQTFQISEAETLAQARAMAYQTKPDLILLDIELPDGDGVRFCEEKISDALLRDIPVIFITSTTEINTKVAGLMAGADDYITKPFHISELRARISVILRRLKKPEPLLHWEEFEVDTEQLKVFRRENSVRVPLDLTPTEFKIFLTLLRHPGKVLSRKDLVKAVWHEGFSMDVRGIDSHVSHLRNKLGPAGKSIKAAYGKGYILAKKQEAA